MEEDPELFSISVEFMIILLVVVGVCLAIQVDKKVKQFGGTYNIGTFKAIVRSVLPKGGQK